MRIGNKIKTFQSFRELSNDNQNESTEYIPNLNNENYDSTEVLTNGGSTDW